MLNTYLLGNPLMRLESNLKFIIFWMFISPNATECTLWWSMGCPLGLVPDPQTPASRFEQTRPSPVRSPPGQYGSARQSESSIALRIDWCRTFFQERFLLSPSSSHQTLEWFALAGTFRVTSAHTHMRRGLGSVMLHFFFKSAAVCSFNRSCLRAKFPISDDLFFSFWCFSQTFVYFSLSRSLCGLGAICGLGSFATEKKRIFYSQQTCIYFNAAPAERLKSWNSCDVNFCNIGSNFSLFKSKSVDRGI